MDPRRPKPHVLWMMLDGIGNIDLAMMHLTVAATVSLGVAVFFDEAEKQKNPQKPLFYNEHKSTIQQIIVILPFFTLLHAVFNKPGNHMGANQVGRVTAGSLGLLASAMLYSLVVEEAYAGGWSVFGIVNVLQILRFFWNKCVSSNRRQGGRLASDYMADRYIIHDLENQIPEDVAARGD